MGIGLGSKCSSSPYAAPNSNPDPKKFVIVREKTVDSNVVLEVQYPNCTNFEGRKIMLYLGYTSGAEIVEHNKGELDPHFSDNEKVSPFARFEPTEAGWCIACFTATKI